MKNKETTNKKYRLRVNLDLTVMVEIEAKNIELAESKLYKMGVEKLLEGQLVDWEVGQYLDFSHPQ